MRRSRTGAVSRGAEQLVELQGEQLVGQGAHRAVNQLAMLKKQHSRDGAYVESSGRAGVCIDVELGDDCPASVVRREALHHWRESPAGRAPACPDVNDDQSVALFDIVGKEASVTVSGSDIESPVVVAETRPSMVSEFPCRARGTGTNAGSSVLIRHTAPSRPHDHLLLERSTMSDHFLLSLPAVDVSTASDAARPLLERAQRESRMIPNMYARMANAPALLATYQDGYARFRAESGFTPAEQEVVFLSISRENECEYCVAAHSFVADVMSGVPQAVTDAIRDDAEIPDGKLAVLSRFSRQLVATRGRPSQAEAQAFLGAGYSEAQILYLVLAVAVKTLSNYSNHLFETPVDAVFKAREWKLFRAAKAIADRVTGAGR